MILADLGADVVKVERPGTGDDTRRWGPPFVGDDAAYFLSLNRNKRSVVLDLSTADGRHAARDLAIRADVLVENFRPGLMASFGLDYGSLASIHPGLVYCSLVAFFDEGDGASRPGYDIIVQALSGLMSFTGHPGGEPTKVGVALLDVIAGLYASNGIQAALLGRARTGRGRKVTVSLFEASLAALVNQAANYLLGGDVPGPMGNEHPNIVPYQLFDSADRPFILAAGNDKLFLHTCEVIERPELAGDPRFATNDARVRNRSELIRGRAVRSGQETGRGVRLAGGPGHGAGCGGSRPRSASSGCQPHPALRWPVAGPPPTTPPRRAHGPDHDRAGLSPRMSP
jgi:crotonobetainyl-CoA:carnitine CoA-transferase CaiB-like acyl-CoA transferase